MFLCTGSTPQGLTIISRSSLGYLGTVRGVHMSSYSLYSEVTLEVLDPASVSFTSFFLRIDDAGDGTLDVMNERLQILSTLDTKCI